MYLSNSITVVKSALQEALPTFSIKADTPDTLAISCDRIIERGLRDYSLADTLHSINVDSITLYSTIVDSIRCLDLPMFTVEAPLEVHIQKPALFGYVATGRANHKLVIPCEFHAGRFIEPCDINFNGASFTINTNAQIGAKYFDLAARLEDYGYKQAYCDEILTLFIRDDNHKVIVFRGMNPEIVSLLASQLFWDKYLSILYIASLLDLKLLTATNDFTKVVPILIAQFQRHDTEEIAQIKSTIDDNNSTIEHYIKTITRLQIANEESRKREGLLRLSLMHTSKMRHRILSELEAVSAVPFVKGINITPEGVIEVFTEAINVDGIVPIGPYLIELSIPESRISIINLKNPQNGFDHPHVNRNSPCWGNYNEILLHLNRGELLTTIELVEVFLSTWNPRDEWGSNLIHWDPKYTFTVFKEMNQLYRLDRYQDLYQEIFGEPMFNDCCPNCGLHPDNCECYCPECDEHVDNCTCNICSECGYHYDECTCYYCDTCGRHEDECICLVCSNCGINIDESGIDYCEDCNTCVDCGCDCNDIEPLVHNENQTEIPF
jgi:hypothetical protein